MGWCALESELCAVALFDGGGGAVRRADSGSGLVFFSVEWRGVLNNGEISHDVTSFGWTVHVLMIGFLIGPLIKGERKGEFVAQPRDDTSLYLSGNSDFYK